VRLDLYSTGSILPDSSAISRSATIRYFWSSMPRRPCGSNRGVGPSSTRNSERQPRSPWKSAMRQEGRSTNPRCCGGMGPMLGPSDGSWPMCSKTVSRSKSSECWSKRMPGWTTGLGWSFCSTPRADSGEQGTTPRQDARGTKRLSPRKGLALSPGPYGPGHPRHGPRFASTSTHWQRRRYDWREASWNLQKRTALQPI